MGKKLLEDFQKQQKNLIRLMMVAILGAAVGFAFQSIYDCVGLILSAGLGIIYFNCFFEYHIAQSKAQIKTDQESDDPFIEVLKRKVQVKAKYVEILCITGIMYIFMSVAFILNAFDTNLFADHEFILLERIEQMAMYPLTLMFILVIMTPIIFKVKINKAGFVCLAFLSMIFPYGVFLLNFFFDFAVKKHLMVIITFSVIGLLFISYFISLSIAIRRK